MPNTVKVAVDADTAKADKKVKKLTSSVDVFSAVAKKAGAIFAGAFVAKKILDFGVATVIASAKAEGLKTQLETLTGSASSANEIFQELIEFSASTPFQIGGITNTTKKLLSFGFAQEEIIEKLKDLGDVAAGSGAGLEELGLIFGQVKAAGKLTGERLLQLQERAIPIGPAIAKTMGIAAGAVRKMVSEGRVSFDIFERAFSSLNDEGNQFAGGMIRQSKTFDGVISTLTDNAEIFAASIGDFLLPVIKKLAIFAIESLQAMTSLARSFGDANAMAQPIPKTMSLIEEQLRRLTNSSDQLSRAMARAMSQEEVEKLSFELSRVVTEIKRLEEARAKLASKGGAAVDPRVEVERGVQAEIKAIREQGFIEEQEHDIMLREIKGEQEAEDIEKLNAFELKKIEITRQANLAKAKLIQDEQKRISEIAKINAKAELKKRQTELKQTKKHEKQLTNIQKLEGNARNDIIKASFALGAALAKSGSKTQFAIQQASAIASSIISSLQASALALATPPGPPFTIPLAASIKIAGALNTAAIVAQTIKGFQHGGIVPGSSFSGDRVPALVNSGELILNRAQQGVIASDLSGRDDRPIIVQIDGREIARAVREEVESGFELGIV